MAKLDPSILAQARVYGLKVKAKPEGEPPKKVTPPPAKEEPSWKETTVTGQIYTGKLALNIGELLTGRKTPGYVREYMKFTPGALERQRAREFSAGVVGIAESWIRPDIPTPAGALVGTALGRPEQFQAYQKGEVSPPYLAGGLFGTYIEAKVTGYGLSKAWSGVKRITPPIIKRPVQAVVTKATKAVKFSRPAKLIHSAKLEISKRVPEFLKRGPISPGEIVIPPAQERISYQWLQASKTAFEMTLAPRTGGVWVGKTYVTEAIKPPMKHLFYTGGKLTIGYLRELKYVKPTQEPGILPFVTQKQVTRMGIIPYVPKLVATGAQKAIRPTAVGFGVVTLARPRRLRPTAPTREEPKLDVPMLARTRERFRSITVQEPLARQRRRLAPVLKVPPLLKMLAVPKALVTPKLAVEPTLKTVLKVPRVLIPSPPRPVLRKSISYPTYPRIPRGGRDISRREKDLFGAWFKREHKIATPEQVLRAFFGGKRK